MLKINNTLFSTYILVITRIYKPREQDYSMKKLAILFILVLSFLSCAKPILKPSFIQFKVKNGSIYVIAKNKHHFPLAMKTTETKTQIEKFTQLKSQSDSTLFVYSTKSIDTIKILKKLSFIGYYGDLSIASHDSTYNYSFPFVKNYQSKIIQGYDGDFSHFGDFSAKTLDFEMAVGDTIVASRAGVVSIISVEHNKQGATKAYRKYGNYMILYHDDNTFSQYVHLKQYGNLVEVGDTVKTNQPIALSGFTGWTTVPHLHFGVYKPTKTGLKSIPIRIDSIPAESLKKGDIIIKT